MELNTYDLILTSTKHPALRQEAVIDCSIDTFCNPKDIAEVFKFLKEKAEERVYLLALNSKGRALGVSEISHGDGISAPITPREVFMRLVLFGAGGFVLIHNHPSGDPIPSVADIKVTKKIIEVGEMMSIPLADHIIIGGDMYFSFREREIMNKKI